MLDKILLLFILILNLLLAGCSPSRSEFTYAPVYAPSSTSLSVAKYRNTVQRSANTHVVARGDTLYSIAWRYNMDYRTLARINGIHAPYSLSVGQRLVLSFPATSQYSKYTTHKARPSAKSRAKTSHKRVRRKVVVTAADKAHWGWPMRGRVTNTFNPAKGKKGINIAGHKGQKIVAARSGRIAYASNGLRDYGNLIIIKHSHEYLSAYAHNAKMFVREGQFVKRGQVIGVIGQTKGNYLLHFEIRKAGDPVNPLKYLAKS